MRKLRRRLTFANVMSVIAVFIALGGAGYAASNLPKNSVGTKQLKKNAVTGDKVKNGSLGGPDVDASTLGQVPSAIHAVSAGTADSAGNANTVGGLSSSAFAPSSRFISGSGDSSQPTPQPVVTVPGALQVSTVASAGNKFELRILDLSSHEWFIALSYGTALVFPSEAITVGTAEKTGVILAQDKADPSKTIAFQYGVNVSGPRLICFAMLSPAV